ncbi:uncharacterized protein LOC124172275 [Ischnura elegans]|nr:uncharacterized protein LOC124172275 [Ischnura elegans]
MMTSWLRTGEVPTDTWETHICRVFEKSRTGKYELATQLEKECMESSEIDASKPLGRGLRRKRRPEKIDGHVETLPSLHAMAHSSYSSSDEDVRGASSRIQSPPPLPSEVPRREKGNLVRPNIPSAGIDNSGTTSKFPGKEARSVTTRCDLELVGETSGVSCKSNHCVASVSALQKSVEQLSGKCFFHHDFYCCFSYL